MARGARSSPKIAGGPPAGELEQLGINPALFEKPDDVRGVATDGRVVRGDIRQRQQIHDSHDPHLVRFAIRADAALEIAGRRGDGRDRDEKNGDESDEW